MAFWFLFSYFVGTILGWFFAYKSRIEVHLEDFIGELIKDGYIKTKGTGDKKEIIKYWEE